MDKNDQVLSALNEHLKFESLLGEFSASLVNLSFQSIDGAIENSIKSLAKNTRIWLDNKDIGNDISNLMTL